MNVNDVKAFTEGIGSAAWRLDYKEFCRVLGWLPETDHSKAKWIVFRTMVSGLSDFTADTLHRLIAAGEEATARSQPAPALPPGNHPMNPRPAQAEKGPTP